MISLSKDRNRFCRRGWGGNIHVLTNAGTICYTKPEECAAKSVVALKKIKPVDDNHLKKLRLEAYAQYCDLAKIPAQLRFVHKNLSSR